MQGNVEARPRLSAARAFLAGAAILAGAATPAFSPARAQEATEDTAMAVPRLTLRGGNPVALPRPLPPEIARAVSAAFANPASPLDGVATTPVIGHILADRYLSPAARPAPDELRDWLSRYGTLPDAPAIYALLCAKLPRGAIPPAAPTLAPFLAAPAGDDIETTDRLLPRNPVLDRTVRDAARAGQFDRAERLVAHTRGLSLDYRAILRAEIARAMFSQGHDLQALALAEAANQEARSNVGLAPWVGGLAAWRLGRFDRARTLFDAAYRAPLTAPGQRAGAAYWAARASLVTSGDHGPWMYRAAKDGRTFYGLLARRVLNQPIAVETPFDRDTLSEADVAAVEDTDRGLRAFALLQVGQNVRAAAELRQLFTETRDQPGFGRSILLVARAAGLQDLATQFGAVMQPAAARLPATRLRPSGGFKLDPALLYALTRMESNFDPAAQSPSGARGLMQLMPVTADYVMAGTGRAPELHNPAANLDVGQRYLIQLSRLDIVGADLIKLLASYNAGPGTFARWLDTMQRETDPLLFIESLPGEETRAYVPRALAYSWLYAAQLGLPSPSLDELAVGLWPRLQARPYRHEAVVRLH
jgi:soluble lytic murein transglycosylase-like protein